MKLTVINVGNKMPDWVTSACAEYLKRINHGQYHCQLLEIKADKNPHKSAAANMAAEAVRIEAAIPRGSYVIALDERGTLHDSISFANLLAQHSSVCFIIGGADGIDPSLRTKAQAQMSLSKLVFPHALVRVIILEQLYRAISILEHHPYHRE